MAKDDIGDTFVCNQCGTVEEQRRGSGRPFSRCRSCRPSGPTGANALRIANAACNQSHICEGCGVTFRPKRAGRTRFCSRECSFTSRRSLAAGPKPRQRKPVTIRSCLQCGETFEARVGTICSVACRERRARVAALESARRSDVRDRSPRPCRECEAVFTPIYGMKRRNFCSQDCCTKSTRRTARIKRKARTRAATVEPVNPTRVFVRDGWLCHLCGGKTDKTKRGTYHPKAPELDHIIPLSKGGPHSYANTACAHRACNHAKSDTVIGQPSLLSA